MHKFTLLFIVFAFALSPSLAFSVDVGDPAPDFNLISTQGQIQLSDYKGEKNVVLALYFSAFTPVWKEELLSFKRDLEKFENLNAQVVGVSDDDLQTLEKFESEFGIIFPLVADEKKVVRKLYGWGRRTFLIDKNGIIRFKHKGVPKNEEFLQELEKLR